ncbi:MAG: putative quinol monooxygenase [Bdellovibrionota bacterium]
MKTYLMVSLLATVAPIVGFAAGAQTEQRALFAYLKVRPGTQQQFLDAAKPVIEESRQESGNLIYILQQSATDPQQFVFYELFRTEGDLELHRNSKHVTEFLKAVAPILIPGQFILEKYVPTESQGAFGCKEKETALNWVKATSSGIFTELGEFKSTSRPHLFQLKHQACGEGPCVTECLLVRVDPSTCTAGFEQNPVVSCE